MLFLYSFVFAISLALISNLVRRSHRLAFDLKPNCLMTRWPLVFITGSRTLFYFSRYFNLYPIFLAEHGYEVFTVHLPWRHSQKRKDFFKKFLVKHTSDKKKYHVIMDTKTREELADLINEASLFASITELGPSEDSKKSRCTPQNLRPLFTIPHETLEFAQKPRGKVLLRMAYFFHKLALAEKASHLNTLGGVPESAIKNSHRLLQRAQDLAEMDLRNDHTT